MKGSLTAKMAIGISVCAIIISSYSVMTHSKPVLQETKPEVEASLLSIQDKYNEIFEFVVEDDLAQINWLNEFYKEKMPEFTGTNKEGITVNSKAILQDDKVNIIYFFATWCSACEQARPEILEFQKANPDANIFIVAGAENDELSVQKYRQTYKEETGNDFPIEIYTVEEKILDDFGIYGFPSLLFINDNLKMKELVNTGNVQVLETLKEKTKGE